MCQIDFHFYVNVRRTCAMSLCVIVSWTDSTLAVEITLLRLLLRLHLSHPLVNQLSVHHPSFIWPLSIVLHLSVRLPLSVVHLSSVHQSGCQPSGHKSSIIYLPSIVCHPSIICPSSVRHQCVIRPSSVCHQSIIRPSSVRHTSVICPSSVRHMSIIRPSSVCHPSVIRPSPDSQPVRPSSVRHPIASQSVRHPSVTR